MVQKSQTIFKTNCFNKSKEIYAFKNQWLKERNSQLV